MEEIQRAVDQAAPGEVVEVPGGVYYGKLHFSRGGEPGRPITLRARQGEPVIFNAGRKLELKLAAVKGHPGVWKSALSADAVPEKEGVWEVASRLRLKRVQTVPQCLDRMASWCYDPQKGELWIHATGEAGEYWVESMEPVVTIGHPHIRVEGIAVTLGLHGILLDRKASHAEVIGCKAYGNRSGGIHVTGNGHRIIGNEAFGNNMYGIQCRYGVEHALIRGNLCYQNGPANEEVTDTSEPTDLGIYSKGAYNLFEGNIAAGFAKNAYRNKYAANPSNIFRGNVVVGNANPAEPGVIGNTFVVDGPGPRAGMYVNGEASEPEGIWEKADPGGRQRAANLITPAYHREDPLFCDPAYYDYRLQSGSPYAGKGAHPGFSPVFYVDPQGGKSGNDGRSVKTAFASLKEALEVLSAGATVYLLPGIYPEPVTLMTGGTDEEPLRIRAWQRSGEVVITGEWTLMGVTDAKRENNVSPGVVNVALEGLTFQGVRLLGENVETGRVEDCRFEGAEAGAVLRNCSGFAMTHCEFVDNRRAVEVESGDGVAITQSVFRKAGEAIRHPGTAGVYADLNRYESTPLPDWGEIAGNDRGSRVVKGAEGEPGQPLGIGFRPAGVQRQAGAGVPEAGEVAVRGLSPHGGTLVWEVQGMSPSAEIVLTSRKDGAEARYAPDLRMQIMGEYFDLSFAHSTAFTRRRHFPLEGLSVDSAYAVAVTPIGKDGTRGKTVTAEFRTPAKATAGRTLYLSPEGDDGADGGSRKTAWRTFRHAVTQLSPGDRLVAMNGVYRESILPVISGTEEAPITIEAEELGKAVIDLSDGLPVGVELLHVHHVGIDGFLLRGGGYGVAHYYFLVNHARGIRITRCENDYPKGSTFEKPKGLANGMVVNDAPGIRIEDNLFLCGIIHIGLSRSPGAVVRHNTIVGEGNYGIVIVPGSAEETYLLEANLFHRAIMGYKMGGILRVFDPIPKITSDYNLYSVPEGHKSGIANWPVGGRIATLKEWQEATGHDLHSIAGTPHFANPEQRDFTLLADSPGKGIAPEDTDVGFRR